MSKTLTTLPPRDGKSIRTPRGWVPLDPARAAPHLDSDTRPFWKGKNRGLWGQPLFVIDLSGQGHVPGPTSPLQPSPGHARPPLTFVAQDAVYAVLGLLFPIFLLLVAVLLFLFLPEFDA